MKQDTENNELIISNEQAIRVKQYEQQMLTAIKKHKLKFLSHVFAYVPFSSATAYNNGLEKLESIKAALDKNRIEATTSMLDKWIEAENATLQLAAMRLVGGSEIRRMLNQQYVELNTNVNFLNALQSLPDSYNEQNTIDVDESDYVELPPESD